MLVSQPSTDLHSGLSDHLLPLCLQIPSSKIGKKKKKEKKEHCLAQFFLWSDSLTPLLDLKKSTELVFPIGTMFLTEQNLKCQLPMSSEKFGERKQLRVVLNSWQKKQSLQVYSLKCAEKK